VASKAWRVSLECQVWSVKCGVQSAQCSGKFKGHRSGLLEVWDEEVTQRAAKVQDDR